MDRRKFLTHAALAGSIAPAIKSLAQEPQHPEKPKPPLTRADLREAPGYRPSGFELDEVTVSDLQRRMQQGELTAERITQLYVARIEEIDRRGPTVNSVIELNPDALSIARQLDNERKSNHIRGPLHGIPVLIKDNIDTNDHMQTTAGSLALAGAPTPHDSFVASRLRGAGAVILGKTNLSEWANFRSTKSTSGWSGRGGQTKNPYALDRNPCGSSSGTGAAVSASLCTVGVGTETDGSVVCPSSMCGLVGIKPTVGLISRAGIIPISHTQDTAGPMARTVRDAAILLGALTGTDARDPITAPSAGKSYTDYTQFLNANGLRGARLGIARHFFNINPAVTAVMEDCITLIRQAGATIIDPVDSPSIGKWQETEFSVLVYEFKADLNAYLAGRGAAVRSLTDCIAFNRAHRAEEMPYFEQEIMEMAEKKGPLTEKAYTDALANNIRLTRNETIDAMILKDKLDALVAPTAGPSWLTDWVAGDHADSGCSSPPAVAGYPHVTVPAGFQFGLPLGISFFGTAWSEPILLKIAYGFEQARNARRKPEFLPTVSFV